MSKPKILVQLDPDPHASVFDAVVAVDSGVEQLLQYAGIAPDRVRDLVHGAMFTRGPDDLRNTAIFVGGSNVATGEQLLRAVTSCFFGPMRVSVMLDANGANTTAAAAVLAAASHVTLAGSTALVLAGTGPVGQRVARLLAAQRCSVRVGSRSQARAAAVCDELRQRLPDANLTPVATSDPGNSQPLEDCQLVIAAGAAGVELLTAAVRESSASLRVAIDLNAVPPVGLAGIGVMDKAVERGDVVCYGAIGVGGTKMKIHKAALRKLFTANDLVLDAEEIHAIGSDIA